ncbi:hypothetical protein TSMG0074 [Halocynthia phage JM-2012]|uniref:hypothetical protein n=1 Tax=Halocynthia phage JM-2012 TaxID=1173297 RepID=UPI00025C691E|nr:hypothetical protein TSMG0074 [Halocynthia phage JM-2012]AFI55357.1 hypothetical protein TSMG0074 [Halocynthia phage JM-2012]
MAQTKEEAAIEDAVIEAKISGLSLQEVKDSDWVCSCFMVTSDENWEYEQEKRYFTSATRKVGGSGLGNGRVLNMPLGINEFCDIPVGFGIDGSKNYDGMGVHYSEGLDDNLDIIHIRPGVPRYSSLGRFYTEAVQADAVKVNEYGWFDELVSNISGALGYLLLLPFKIVASPFNVLGKLLSNDNTNRYSYYYLAPATHTYWKTLDNIVNDFALRSGLIPGAAYDGKYDDGSEASKSIRPEDLEYFKNNLPGVYVDGTFGVPRIDVLAISARHTLLTSRREDYLAKQLNGISQEVLDEDYLTAWQSVMRNHNPWGDDESVRELDGIHELGDALSGTSRAMKNNYDKIVKSNLSTIVDANNSTQEVTVNDDGTITASEQTTDLDYSDNGLTPEMDDADFITNFSAVTKSGADWISLAVDQVTESTISINNTSGPSGLASMLNGMVSSMRGVNFNIAGGNIGDNVGANLVEGIISTGGAAISGLTNQFVGGMPSAILGGKAFIDFPDVYQESTMEFNSMNYTLTSVASSGHPLAKLRMLMPYFALLALTSPRSGGPSSYTPPYLVEVQHKGRGIVQMGMIGSLEATFGTEDGWDINDIPNEVSISFGVTNLSKGFHVPVDPSLSLTYADTGEFCLHMGVLAGVSLTDRDKSIWYNAKRSAMRLSQRLDRATSSTYWAHLTGTVTKDLFGGVLAMSGHYVNRR